MRIVVVAIWSILISSAISYVLTSMAGEPFNFIHTLILSGIFLVVITLLGDVLLKEEHE